MASSRWKRFAFFDRHTLNLPSSVLEDLLLDTDRMNTISMQITTAALPLSTKIQLHGDSITEEQQEQEQQEPLSAMWSSLTACSAPSYESSSQHQESSAITNIHLPSQQSTLTTFQATNELVLVWIASPNSPYVHCLDISLTCRALPDELSRDGWRGYVANENDGIVDIAVCRMAREETDGHSPLCVACLTETSVTIHVDPHLHLSCRLPVTPSTTAYTATTLTLQSPWNETQHGHATTLDMTSQGLLAIGTNTGHTLLYEFSTQGIFLKLTIPPPPQAVNSPVTSLNLSTNASLFCTYLKGGISSFEISPSATISARHDLDSRLAVLHKSCVDYLPHDEELLVARPDGLYTYSQTSKTSVSPIDGMKNAICAVPARSTSKSQPFQASYALVASTDVKSGRDAVDIYDATNKLVAFHVLLSPGHRALRAVGISTSGRSTAVVLSSGGSLVSLTEKETSCKISLLVQKNLYAAAISMAYADPAFQPADITALYRRHAEHLYRKGDFSAAMDQYIYTIGSLESAHVIFRYLDAPKIPMLAKYLEELRDRDMATPVHNELLRTCYLKLNDEKAAEKIAASASRTTDTASCSSLVSSLAHNPKEALATICTLEAPQAAEALLVHGAVLARALPRETAGVVVSLCVGTYSPSALAAEASGDEAAKMLEVGKEDVRPRRCTPYPFHLFASAFVESPKVLRLILAHCNRNKCPLTPSLRRSLLELTLSEWNDARRTGDTEAEKLRRKEAITALTDAHSRDIGDYDALVLVQLAGFAEGELLLYERLQMTPMLLARYAQDGGDRARRHMLAMCRTDPEILADVLGHFVAIASKRIQPNHLVDDSSLNSEEEDILDDIREALALARAQGALPPVRIARILAGEGSGQFSVDSSRNEKEPQQQTVPLSVALDYVGAILDDSRQDISRLKSEVEEYNQLCNSMEAEVKSLLSGQSSDETSTKPSATSRMNIQELHSRLKSAIEEGSKGGENRSAQLREAFWREMNQSEDRYDTIARFFAKGIIQ